RREPWPSAGLHHELGQPHEIVGGGREGEGPSDTVATAELRLVLPSDRLDPAERLLDTLADALAGDVAAMARRATVDRRTSAADVLRYMRRHLHRAQLVDEVLRVVSLVGAERDGPRPVSPGFDHVQCRHPLGITVGQSQAGIDQKAMAVLHQPMPHEAQLCLLALALALLV